MKEWKGSLSRTVIHDGTNYNAPDVDRYFKYNKECNIPIEYGAMAGGSRVIGEVRSNNIGIVGFSASGTMTFTFRARIRYMDA